MTTLAPAQTAATPGHDQGMAYVADWLSRNGLTPGLARALSQTGGTYGQSIAALVPYLDSAPSRTAGDMAVEELAYTFTQMGWTPDRVRGVAPAGSRPAVLYEAVADAMQDPDLAGVLPS